MQIINWRVFHVLKDNSRTHNNLSIQITPNSQCALNALAIDEPMEYARLVLDGEMQAWIDAEDSLEVW